MFFSLFFWPCFSTCNLYMNRCESFSLVLPLWYRVYMYVCTCNFVIMVGACLTTYSRVSFQEFFWLHPLFIITCTAECLGRWYWGFCTCAPVNAYVCHFFFRQPKMLARLLGWMFCVLSMNQQLLPWLMEWISLKIRCELMLMKDISVQCTCTMGAKHI